MGTLTGPGLGKFTCGELATCSLSDLGSADAGDITSGTFGLARIPTMDDAHIPDLETLSYGGTFAEAQIPNLPTTKITEGTFGAARIPVLPTSRYGSAVLVDGSRPMAGTLNIGNHVIDNARRYMFGGGHEVSLRSMGTYDLYVESKDALHWSNVWMGDLSANRAAFYGTVNMQGHPITGVVAPTSGSHAANKSYVDAQGGGGIGTHANEYHDPDMLCVDGSNSMSGTLSMNGHPLIDVPTPTLGSYAANKTWVDSHDWGAGDITSGTFADARIPDLPTSKITSGTFDDARIPILPIDRYGSAVLVDGSRSMEGTFSMGTHEIDHLKKVMFREEHDVALITEGTYGISVVNKAESLWGILETGHLYTHAGFAWYIEDKQAGVNLSAGNLVFLHSDSKWLKTDADTESATRGLLGIAMAAISANNTGRVCIFGGVTNAGWSWTTGATLYVSCTAGGITETAPSGSGDSVRKIGHALSSTTIIFNQDATILEIT